MISCRECIEGLKPDNPQVRGGKYNLCGCDYCDKPTYFRELEEKPTREKLEITHLKMVDAVGIGYLRRNLVQHIDKKFKELQDKGKVDKQYTIK